MGLTNNELEELKCSAVQSFMRSVQNVLKELHVYILIGESKMIYRHQVRLALTVCYD